MGDRRRRAVRAAVAPGDDSVTTACGAARRGRGWARAEHPHAAAPRAHARLDARARARARAAALLLAALLHDIERAVPDPGSPFDSGARLGARRLRRLPPGALGRHLARWLAERGAAPDEIARRRRAGRRARARRLARGRPRCRPPTRSRSSRRSRRSLREWVATAARPARAALAKLDFMWERIRVAGRARARPRALRERARGGRVTRAGCGPETLDEALALRVALGDDALPSPAAPSSACSLRRASSAAGAPSSRSARRAGARGHRARRRRRSRSARWRRTAAVERERASCATAGVRSRDCFGEVANVRVRNVATVGGVLADADYASDPPCDAAARSTRASSSPGPGGERELARRRADPRPLRDGDRAGRAARARARPAAASARPTASSARARSEDRPCVGVAVAAATRSRGGERAQSAESAPVERPAAAARARSRALRRGIDRSRPPRLRRLPPAHGRRRGAPRARELLDG